MYFFVHACATLMQMCPCFEEMEVNLQVHYENASVVHWLEYLVTDPEVPAPIPGATRVYEKYWAWNGVHSAL
jgi:hypothetical protein